MALFIKGQSGKGLDSTSRTLASMKMKSGSVQFSSLDDDVLEWASVTDDATGAGVILPTLGQQVELFDDSARRFSGHVLTTRISMDTLTVKVVGPWWWMNQINITSNQTDGTGTQDDRPSFVFQTQDLRTSFIALINRAIADGVPIALGTIDTMFTFPRITLSEMNYAQAFTELMTILPDAVMWFDYSGTGLPKLNIDRRPTMSNLNLSLDLPGNNICGLDIWPRTELEVKKVTVSYQTRRPLDGYHQFQSNFSGSEVIGKKQTIVVSGYDVNNSFLPKDVFDHFELKTAKQPSGGVSIADVTEWTPSSMNSIGGDLAAYIINNDPALATISRSFAGFSSSLTVANGGAFWQSINTNGSSTVYKFVHDMIQVLSNKSLVGQYLVTSPDDVPDWASKQNGYTVTDASVTAYVFTSSSSTSFGPTYWDTVLKHAKDSHVGYPYGTYTSDPNRKTYTATFVVSLSMKLISLNQPTLTTMYRKSDYDYISPPTGLAANMLASQNWVPWQGAIQQVGDYWPCQSELKYKLNLAGSLPGCTNMGALMKSQTFDFLGDRKTFTIGPPDRVDFVSLASKFRRSPADNIVYL